MVKAGTAIGLSRTTRQRSLKFPEMIVNISVNASRVFAAPNFIGKKRKTPTSDAWARGRARVTYRFGCYIRFCGLGPDLHIFIYLNPT
jgi:hypothetical protein